jgi:hypothetical protein
VTRPTYDRLIAGSIPCAALFWCGLRLRSQSYWCRQLEMPRAFPLFYSDSGLQPVLSWDLSALSSATRLTIRARDKLSGFVFSSENISCSCEEQHILCYPFILGFLKDLLANLPAHWHAYVQHVYCIICFYVLLQVAGALLGWTCCERTRQRRLVTRQLDHALFSQKSIGLLILAINLRSRNM